MSEKISLDSSEKTNKNFFLSNNDYTFAHY